MIGFFLISNLWAQCPVLDITKSGVLSDPDLNEISGIQVYKEHLWVHNDSGDRPRVFLLSTNGERERIVNIPSAKAKDWEDITLLREPTIFFLGDVGDNLERRSEVEVYLYNPSSNQTQTMTLQYETGPKDVEALAIDPVHKDLYLMSKGRGGVVHLFQKKFPHVKGAYRLESVHSFPIPSQDGLNPFRITAMDISPKGDRIAVRNYFQLFLWSREAV
ncbi:MAG: hypothetical protein VX278_05445 [Myxococcota bacterium]|nr:hypothetical protein [Myxococcota bacterium]